MQAATVPSRLPKLALLSQLVAVSVILPAPVLALVGPFFLWMLSYAFLGGRWTLLFIAVDALVDLPQYLISSTGTVSVAPEIVGTVIQPGSPLEAWISGNVLLDLVLIISLSAFEFVMVRMFIISCWRNVKAIRARVPWSS